MEFDNIGKGMVAVSKSARCGACAGRGVFKRKNRCVVPYICGHGIFGKGGEKFIRVSLCSPEEKFTAAIERIEKIIPALQNKEL